MFQLARVTRRRAREERLAQTAGSLTFTTVLSLVPLLALSFALFTQVPALRSAGLAVREHLLQGLLPAELSRAVLKHLSQFAAMNTEYRAFFGKDFPARATVGTGLVAPGAVVEIMLTAVKP